MEKPKSTVEVGTLVFGYRNGLRHFSRPVQMLLSSPREFYLEDARRYLEETLGIEDLDETGVKKAPGVELDPAFETYVGFITTVALQALKSGSYPAHEQVLVLSSQPGLREDGRTKVLLLAPGVTRLTSRSLLDAFNLAIPIAEQFELPSQKRTKITELTDKDLDNFVKTTRSRTGGGTALRHILKEAFDRDISSIHLGNGPYQFGSGRSSKVFCRTATHADSLIGARLTVDKLRCINHLRAAGIPVPSSTLVEDEKDAQTIARQIGFPVVIKPSNRDRGEGVTVDIETEQEVTEAFERARKLSDSILVENRVPGICHRLVVFRDQFIFAFARHPYSVVGDGESNIRQLAEQKQEEEAAKAKHLRRKTCGLDEIAMSQLARQDCTPDTVPKSDQIVYLRPYEGEIWGGYNEYLTEKVHPENAELARRTARLFHLEVAGIDLISEDITRPWYETGAVINEVNFDPQFRDNTSRIIFDTLFPDGEACIRIECYIGDEDALEVAMARRTELARKSDGVFLTSHEVSLDGAGHTVHLSNAETVFHRSLIFLQDDRVECLIVAIHSNELLDSGLPFRNISAVEVVNKNLFDFRDGSGLVEPAEVDELLSCLEEYKSDCAEP